MRHALIIQTIAWILSFSLFAAPLAAQNPPTDPTTAPKTTPQHVPISENYSTTELAWIAVMYPASLVGITLGGHIFSQPTPSMSAPLPGSFDYRISHGFHGDLTAGKPLFYGIPDKSAYAMAALPALYYGTSSLYLLIKDENLFAFQDSNIHHTTIAFAEAFGWTALLTTGVKFLVGRPRPYVSLDRPAYGWKPEEENLSFFSGHASLSFAAATFLYLDISNTIARNLSDDYSGFTRFLIANALPATLLYGTSTFIATSRVYDQKHYFSDVLIGAMVGTLTTALVYNSRFDSDGNPHQKHTPDAPHSATLTTSPSLFFDGHQSAVVWNLTLTL